MVELLLTGRTHSSHPLLAVVRSVVRFGATFPQEYISGKGACTYCPTRNDANRMYVGYRSIEVCPEKGKQNSIEHHPTSSVVVVVRPIRDC